MGISTHILDTALGRPARGVGVTLEHLHESTWLAMGKEHTDQDGRCKHLLREEHTLEAGMYRLRFETADYFAALGVVGLYPFVEITFDVSDAGQHFHIPLLLTPNGYTTYRGS